MLEFNHLRDGVSLTNAEANVLAGLVKGLEFTVPDYHPGLTLELGAGSGNYSRSCNDLGIETVSIDLRNLYRARGHFVQSDAELLPFKDNSFNLVIENLFFDDLLSLQGYLSLDSVLEESSRVLVPGGFVLTACPNVMYSKIFKPAHRTCGLILYRSVGK